MLPLLGQSSKFAGLSLIDMGNKEVYVEIVKKGEGQEPPDLGVCFSLPPSSLEDDQIVLTCPKQPELFQSNLDISPHPGSPEAFNVTAPPMGKMYFWRNKGQDEDLINYTFRHPIIGQFTRWLWDTPEGQKAPISEVKKHLLKIIQDVVFDGLSEEEKQQNPFVRAFSPDSQYPAYLSPHQEKPAFAWTILPFPKRKKLILRLKHQGICSGKQETCFSAICSMTIYKNVKLKTALYQRVYNKIDNRQSDQKMTGRYGSVRIRFISFRFEKVFVWLVLTRPSLQGL